MKDMKPSEMIYALKRMERARRTAKQELGLMQRNFLLCELRTTVRQNIPLSTQQYRTLKGLIKHGYFNDFYHVLDRLGLPYEDIASIKAHLDTMLTQQCNTKYAHVITKNEYMNPIPDPPPAPSFPIRIPESVGIDKIMDQFFKELRDQSSMEGQDEVQRRD